MPDTIGLGEYVLATKYSDGSNFDRWFIGYYAGEDAGRHFVTDASGNQVVANGFRRAEKITEDEGAFLLCNIPRDSLPEPNEVGIWDMLAAFRASVDCVKSAWMNLGR